MTERAIGTLLQIPPGEGRNFVVDETPIAVFHTRGGAVFATQAQCPHRGGPLADGLTDGVTVMCPLHDRIYDLASGSEIGGACVLDTYKVRIGEDGTLLLSR